MNESEIYTDIAKRTGGDIYIGVVGPVRTGKSTFIHKMIDNVVLPNIENDYDKQRTLDQIPQSASGRTVMTTEPKFVPDESVRIKIASDTEMNVKLIDCVGYMVEGALGDSEDGESRMIMTPWSDEAMPFSEAAELGTGKVIGEHSTIGMLVTTDGTITDIPRENYIEAEERVAAELKKLGKPFAIVLNSRTPKSEYARCLAEELEKKYSAPVALVNCTELNGEDIKGILSLVLGEFPLRTLSFKLPAWTTALDKCHPLRQRLTDRIRTFTESAYKLGDISRELDNANDAKICSINAGDGTGILELPLDRDVYLKTLCEITGLDVSTDKKLFESMISLSKIKEKYDRVATALDDVESKGYGIVMPTREELTLEEPKLIKQPGGYGVRVCAKAESIHMIKTGIRADVCPVVGTEEQSEEVIKYLSAEYEESPDKIWESNMFGRSLYDLVSDGMYSKLSHMPDESREKLGETLEKIINEGASGLVCILL